MRNEIISNREGPPGAALEVHTCGEEQPSIQNSVPGSETGWGRGLVEELNLLHSRNCYKKP